MVVDFQGIWKLLNFSAFAETLSSCDVWKFPLDWNRWNRNDIAKITGKQFGISKITKIAFQIVVSSGKKKPWPHRNSGAFFNERLPLMNAYLEPSTKKKQTTLIRLSFGVDTAGHRRCRYAKFLRFKFLLRLAAKLIDIVRVLSLGFVFLGWLGFYFRSIKIVINQFNSY